MAKLIDFPIGLNEGESRLDFDPDDALTGAVGKLTEVVIVGYEADGSLYFAFNRANNPICFGCLNKQSIFCWLLNGR